MPPGSPPSRPPSEEPTLAGEPGPRDGPADGPSRPPSDEDTLLAAESMAVVRAAPAELDGGEPTRIARYEILRRIGEGGMGLIFAARDPELDRKVAIKLVRPALHERSGDARARLLREAQTLAKITHPNVIHVYEVGTFGEQVFVAMEFVDGRTLRDWQWKEHVTWKAILDAYVAAARGLAAAHARGMVHRDFKPDNVLIGNDGKVRVIDFGLARGGDAGPDPSELIDTARDVEWVAPDGVDIAQPMTRLTKTGAILGTPAYMAPEQHHGRPADGRTDQFSFCVALYEALYGMRPFAGKTYPALVRNVLDGRVEEEPRFVEVPAWIRRALLRGLSVEPSDRFPSMDALINEFRADPSTRTRRRGLVAGVLALGVIGAGTWSAVDGARDRDRDRDELRDALARHRLDRERAQLRPGAATPSQAWNDYVLAHARARLDTDPSTALASLRSLADPDPDTLAATRLVAERALARGVATTFPDAAQGIDLIAVSPDGSHIALGADARVEVWTGRKRTRSLTSPMRATACALGNEGARILIGHEDGSALLVDESEWVIELHEQAVTAVAVSPTTDHVATADASGDVAVWRIVDGQPEIYRRAQRHTEAVRGLAFSPDGAELASSGDDGRVVRWKLEQKSHRDFESGAVAVSDVVWQGSRALAVLGSDGSLTRWFPETGSRESLANDVRHIAATPDGLLALDDAGHAVLAPAVSSGAALDEGLTRVLALAPDRFLSLDGTGRVQTWTVRVPMPTPIGDALPGAWLVALSPDGGLVVAATHDGRVQAWDRASGEQALSLPPMDTEIAALSVAPGGGAVVFRTEDGRLSGAVTGSRAGPTEPSWSTPPCGYAITGAATWSHDGAVLAAFECAPLGVAVRGADGDEVARATFELGARGRHLRFSDDASRLYVDPGAGSAVRLIDARDGAETPLEWDGPAPARRIAQAWASEDTVRVIGVDAGGELGLWEQARARGPLLRIDSQPVAGVRTDATATHVLTDHADGATMLWDVRERTDRALPALPEDAFPHFSLSPDSRWLLAQAGERSRPGGLLIHVPSGEFHSMAGLFPPAAVHDGGLVADANGERVRVWTSPIPQTWSVFLEWVGQVTDPIPPIDMSIGPGFGPDDG